MTAIKNSGSTFPLNISTFRNHDRPNLAPADVRNESESD